jgi:hypothetical protein
VGTAPVFASAREALDMARAGLGYLAAADPGQLATATQAEFLRELEQDAAVATAARAGVLAAFTAGQGRPSRTACCCAASTTRSSSTAGDGP